MNLLTPPREILPRALTPAKLRSVLFFDPFPSLCEVVRLVLEDDGLRVITTTSLEECRQKIRDHHWDLLVADDLDDEREMGELVELLEAHNPGAQFMCLSEISCRIHRMDGQTFIEAVRTRLGLRSSPSPGSPDGFRRLRLEHHAQFSARALSTQDLQQDDG